MPILNHLLAKIVLQDIVNANGGKAMQTSFNTLFHTYNILNFYARSSHFSLAYHHSKEYKNLIITDGIS